MPPDDRVRDELNEQRLAIERLNTTLTHHTEQLQTTLAAAPDDGLGTLDAMLRAQAEAVENLTGLLGEQTTQIARLDSRLESQESTLFVLSQQVDGLAAVTLPGLSMRLDQHSDTLSDLRVRLDGLTAAESGALARLDTRLDALDVAARLDQQGRVLDDLRTRLEGLTTVESDTLARLDARLDALDVAARLDQQGVVLDDLRTRLEGLTAAESDTLSRLDTRLDALDRAAQEAIPMQEAEPLAGLIQAQADRLVSIGARLDEWADSRPQLDDRLAEHARVMADLDRQLADAAQRIQALDARSAEHTDLLHAAAEERREQAGVLERLTVLLADLFPLVRQVISAPRRVGSDRDRLTDIKGIGPVYSGRLHEAGISTFRQLASMTPDELRVIINEPTWRNRNIAYDSWIEQAMHLASQREKVESML
jgi:predicted flap endonuclease-1-like 5' DNA nuclease